MNLLTLDSSVVKDLGKRKVDNKKLDGKLKYRHLTCSIKEISNKTFMSITAIIKKLYIITCKIALVGLICY